MPSSVHVLTGATSGLGLEAARRLLAEPGNRVLAGVRSPGAARALRDLAGPDRLTLLPLDLASLSSTVRFAGDVIGRLDGGRAASLAANAGLQFAQPRPLTPDGFEETFQVNWLGHAILVEFLLPHLSDGAPIVVTASGTHDPGKHLARAFGYRGGIFPGIDRVARGELDVAASPVQKARDRYATSKLCGVLHAYALARRLPAGGARVIAFDPGLMPGTGLARDGNAVVRWGWSRVLPVVVAPLPGTSTARRSGTALASILQGRALAGQTGRHVDFTLGETASSRDSQRTAWQDEVDAFARAVASRIATTREAGGLFLTTRDRADDRERTKTM